MLFEFSAKNNKMIGMSNNEETSNSNIYYVV